MQQADITVFGEDHMQNTARKLIAEFLPKLKAAGYTHLGLELLSRDQGKLIKAFEQNLPGAEAELRVFIGDPHNCGFMSEKVDEYMALIKAARDHGIKIVPLRHPHILEEVHQHLRYYPALFERDLDVRFRDVFMTLGLEEIFEATPNAKVVALMGLGHTDSNNGVPRILKEEFGRRVTSVGIIERPDVEENSLFEVDQEMLARIPVYTTLSWRHGDPQPKVGDWLILAPHPA
jgi:uncharacterized iron-regulated protein